RSCSARAARAKARPMSHFFCACHGMEALLASAEGLTSGAIDVGRAFALPGDAPQWGRSRPFAIDSLVIRVALELDQRSVEGECDIGVRRVDVDAKELALD